MKRLITALVAVVAGAGALVTVGSPAAAANTTLAGPAAATPAGVQQQLALARAASARYHDVQAAIADGYLPADSCAELPGVGGMGYHYINPANVGDGVFDVTKPEILLYVPTEQGVRLAGVEFFQADADQNLATDNDRPSLFGIGFNGPMPGHEPGMPIHYDLHVWLWLDNPDGLFAPWNPRVTCSSATTA